MKSNTFNCKCDFNLFPQTNNRVEVCSQLTEVAYGVRECESPTGKGILIKSTGDEIPVSLSVICEYSCASMHYKCDKKIKHVLDSCLKEDTLATKKQRRQDINDILHDGLRTEVAGDFSMMNLDYFDRDVDFCGLLSRSMQLVALAFIVGIVVNHGMGYLISSLVNRVFGREPPRYKSKAI